MIKLEDIKSSIPSLGSNLRTLNQRITSLKNCPAMHMVTRTKEFIQRHPFVSLFLIVFIVLGFLPFIIFAAFVSSSFLVVLLSAIMIFGGTIAVALASFLVVLFPILMFGGGVASFFYLTYCAVVTILQIIKGLRSTVKSFGLTRRVRRQAIRIDASPEDRFPVDYDHSFIPAANEELLGESLNNSFLYTN